MAEVTERDREFYAKYIRRYVQSWVNRQYHHTDQEAADEGIAEEVLQGLLAYREECVAEERAARVKVAQERDEAQKNYRWMVEHAADNKLAGYRDLGKRAADAEDRADRAESRLRAVIEAADRLVASLNDCESNRGCFSTAGEHDYRCPYLPPGIAVVSEACECGRAGLDVALAAYRRVRDAQPASPEPEASKQADHEWHPLDWINGGDCEFPSRTTPCTICGLPWSKHGGRDGE